MCNKKRLMSFVLAIIALSMIFVGPVVADSPIETDCCEVRPG
jgi:hypothetical protein